MTEIMTNLKCVCVAENGENIKLICLGLIPGRNKEAAYLGKRTSGGSKIAITSDYFTYAKDLGQ